MSKRVCLISPGHVSFNPRLVKEADALASAGYSVHVIAANDLPQLRKLDEPILARARWTFDLVGGQAASDKARRCVAKLARRLLAAGLYTRAIAEYGHHGLTAPLRDHAIRHSADLYVAHYIAALPAAFDAAQRHRAKWGFDAEDFHRGEFSTAEQTSAEALIVKAIEDAYLPHATHFTAASPGIATAYARLLGRETPLVLLNVFPRAHAPAAMTAGGIAAPGPSLYWFSQTIGANRGLECALRAISKARSRPHLYLRGNMQSEFENALRSLAASCGVNERLHLLPTAPGAEMERLASAYDIGLVAETGHTENRAIALTNKLFSFLLAGVPAVVSDIPAHRPLAQACTSIKLFRNEDPESLAAAIDLLLSDPQNLAVARAQAWRLGQTEYNWDIEQAKLIALVEREIGPP